MAQFGLSMNAAADQISEDPRLLAALINELADGFEDGEASGELEIDDAFRELFASELSTRGKAFIRALAKLIGDAQ